MLTDTEQHDSRAAPDQAPRLKLLAPLPAALTAFQSAAAGLEGAQPQRAPHLLQILAGLVNQASSVRSLLQQGRATLLGGLLGPA